MFHALETPERLNFLSPTFSNNMADVLNSEMGHNHVLIKAHRFFFGIVMELRDKNLMYVVRQFNASAWIQRSFKKYNKMANCWMLLVANINVKHIVHSTTDAHLLKI